MADQTDGLETWLHDFVATQSDEASIDEWAARTTASIVAEIPEVAADAVLSHAIQVSTRAHWRSFLRHLEEPDREFHLVQPAVDLAVDLAQRGYQLPVLFGIYRLGQRAVWQFITSVVADVPGGVMDEAGFLTHFWSRASAWLDASIEESVRVFSDEHDRIRQGVAAEQLVTVREVLAGRGPEIRELSAVLGGHPVSGFNTAVLLHTDDHDAVADLEDAARRLAGALGTKHPLMISPGGRDLWCWLGTRSVPDLTRLHPAAPWLLEHRIVAAVGTAGEGVEGFRLSHREAVEAQKIAFRATGSRTLTLYGEVEVLALVSGSPEAARRFVQRTLGALAAPGEGNARLRATVHTLLRSGSVDAAAQELMVHKNTVRYRAGQAEALLGFPLSRAAADLELALRYFETFLAEATP